MRRSRRWAAGDIPPPYDLHDGDADPVRNPERFFEARNAGGRLVGFYYFEPRGEELEYGLRLRPDLTGRGLGLRFVSAGLAFADDRNQLQRVVLSVAEFNQRARRVYEKAGFRLVSRHARTFDRFGGVAFVTMEAPGGESRN